MRVLIPICCMVLAVAASGAAAQPAISQPIQRAVADTGRPASDVARDVNRKPAETLAFAGVEPGDQVADYIANTGYFTRLFSDIVGPKGHVYAVELNEIVSYANVAKGYAALKAWAPDHPNTTVETVAASAPIRFSHKLDVFWTSQNYHDLHDKFLGPVDIAAFNRQVFAALKPGGLYIVLDHRAARDAPANVTETLHRIDPDTVKREVEAAGFELVAESPILANPSDPLTIGVFNKAIAGHTDQFILKFRRPVKS